MTVSVTPHYRREAGRGSRFLITILQQYKRMPRPKIKSPPLVNGLNAEQERALSAVCALARRPSWKDHQLGRRAMTAGAAALDELLGAEELAWLMAVATGRIETGAAELARVRTALNRIALLIRA